MRLEALGWRDEYGAAFRAVAARVAVEHKTAYVLYTERGEILATLAGRLRYQVVHREQLPAVGDWVVVRDSLIEGVLPRRTEFARRAAGTTTEAQVIAANIDTVFVVCGLDGDFNLRRIERYWTLARASGAACAVLLNKADLCADPEQRVRQVLAVTPGGAVHALSARSGEGVLELTPYLTPGLTVAMVGSSGVGKSTLINRLLGRPKQFTKAVRESDSRGRHATTHRELIVMESGALLIDTPGLRELQLWVGEQDVGGAFEDIAALAAGCRFRDCRHQNEDGCAVQEALEAGRLDFGRFENYRKMMREAAYLDRKLDKRAELEEKARWKRIHKAMRATDKRR